MPEMEDKANEGLQIAKHTKYEFSGKQNDFLETLSA